MFMRLLFAAPHQGDMALFNTTLHAALCLMPFEIIASETNSARDLMQRVEAGRDDIIILDWALTGEETPDIVSKILAIDPRLRVIVLLPENLRQYRQQVWQAGACNGIPKEHMDQEWFSHGAVYYAEGDAA